MARYFIALIEKIPDSLGSSILAVPVNNSPPLQAKQSRLTLSHHISVTPAPF